MHNDLSLARLTTRERIIAWRLSSGRCVCRTELFAAIWGEPEDGGPLAPDNCIGVHLVRLRRKLAACGVEIKNTHGRGWEVHQPHLARLVDLLAEEVSRAFPPRRHLRWQVFRHVNFNRPSVTPAP